MSRLRLDSDRTRRLITFAVVAIAALLVITLVVSYVLWTGDDNPPSVVTTE